MRTYITCFLFILSASHYASGQCSNYTFGGPSSACTGSPLGYFISGGNIGTGTISGVSGDATSRTWTSGSGTITWLQPGSYTINFSCTCGVVPQVVTVTAAPTINSTITPSSQTICSGQTPAAISVAATDYSGAIYGWQMKTPAATSWTSIAGTAGLNVLPVANISNSQTNQYRMVLFQCSQYAYSGISTVTVNTPPTTPETPTTGDIVNTCSVRGPIGISTNYASGYTITHYYYDQNGNLLSTQPTTNPTGTVYVSQYTPTSGTQFQLQAAVQGVGGCGTVLSARKTINYTVNPAPTAPPLVFLFNSSPVTSISLCQGESINVSASGGTSNYQWYTPLGGSPFNTSSTLSTYIPQQSGTYTVSATWANPCGGSSSIQGTLQITINTPTSPTIQGPSTFCQGGTNSYTVSAPGASNVSYQWTLNGSNVSTIASYSIPSSQLDGTSTVGLSMQADYSGCLTRQSFNSITPVQVIIKQKPNIPDVTGNSRFGDGVLQLNASSQTIPPPNGPGVSDFNWYTPQGTFHGSSYTTPSFTNGTSITNYLTVTASSLNGCESGARSVDLNLFTLPQISFYGTNYLPPGGSAILQVGAYDSYSWTNSLGQTLGSGPTQTISVPNLTYSVTVQKSGASILVSKPVGNNLDGVNENFVEENTILKSSVTTTADVDALSIGNRSQNIQYLDGLGRPLQTVTTQGSPSKTDIVQSFYFDNLGRESKHFLPITIENNGRIKPIQVDAAGNYSSTALSFYSTTPKVASDASPFSQASFEPSPLNRVSEQGGPGTAWQPGTNHTIKKTYGSNLGTEVLLFNYDPSTGLVTLSNTSYYGTNQLTATHTTDEQSHEVIEYVDKLGHTVCKKVQSGGTDAQGNKLYASTYYIYDDLGNLVVVLPPEAIKSALGYLSPQN